MVQNTASPTLDGLFRRILARQPEALALIDPPDKTRVTGEPPLRLTFAQADRAIAALAAHFIAAGLPPHAIIAVQLPNTVEHALTILAAHRAGLVVALMPQLWRHADLAVALNRIGARAVVGCARIDGVSHGDLIMNAAAEAFSVRHVFGFGSDLPAGMMPLDDLVTGDGAAAAPPPLDARAAALVSFDVAGDGLIAVPRTHLNLISGGLAIFLESGMAPGGTLLTAQCMGSFAGLAATLACWLLSGGTLALHHPFDGEVLEQQLVELKCDTLVCPAALAMRLGGNEGTPRNVIALWRTPEQVASSPVWPHGQTRLTDVYVFGEAGLFSARRAADGAPAAIMPGPFGAPRDDAQSPVAGEALLTEAGTLALRGSMVPLAAYAPPGRSAPPADHVDTGYAARLDRATGAVCITAPPPGIMAVGGYRFRADDLLAWARRLGDGAMLTALPDRLSGHRLAGRADDNAGARAALAGLGLNPLMVEAFRDRDGPD
ncbi:MAG: AMP-binding protein [Xanthobacteraceae bacterium]|nr:AMP-binding protein [Xanthobacteraceae bacterium]